jgi:C-terminal processing protease CtpA/Prc
MSILFSLICFAQPQTKYSAQQVKTDFEYLYKTLDASHYNLYAFTKKEVFDSVYRKIEVSIKDSLTSLQVYRLFQPYLALAKMGECNIFFPFDDYGNYLEHGGTLFPLNLHFSKGKVFIKDNFSNEPQITVGNELILLNGKPITKVMEGIYSFVSGQSEYYKNSIIELLFFSRIFWFVNDKCDVFSLTIKGKDGRELKLQVPAIPGYIFEGKIRQQKTLLNKEREFRFINNIAYLHPGEFLSAEANNLMNHETFDKNEFCHFIDSAFSAFHKMNAKSLIIDLRNNPGGDNSFSDYMVAYFASKPFCFCSKFKVKTSQTTKEFWKDVNIPYLQGMKQDILSHENGACFDVSLSENQPQTDSLRFSGKVYVLVNRFSFSNTSSAAATIQDYRFGKLIGEETPDIPSFYGGTHQFKLPNTQWPVTYPKAYIIRPNGDISLKGVIPDYKDEDNIFTPEDEILDYTLKLIKENKY